MTSDSTQGHVYRGVDANLAVVRAASDTSAHIIALEEYLDKSKDERLLLDSVMRATVTLTDNFESEPGRLVITSERLLFYADEPDHVSTDLAIDAACIDLHAIAVDQSLYVQIQTGLPDSNDNSLLELYIHLQSPKSENDTSSSTLVFQRLSELISLHPIDPNDDHDDNHDGWVGDVSDNDDDMIVACHNDTTSSQDERDAMLERLDTLLVVPPELELTEDHGYSGCDGQFDDADDDALL
jgi:hypothetical protein